MAEQKMKKFLFGAALVGGLGMGATSCSKDKEPKDAEKVKTEVEINKPQDDKYGNVALFESCRSDIKFALAFVENYYPYNYWDGKRWTTGHGLTVLYNADGSHIYVAKDTKVPTLAESDVFKGRYLTHEVVKDVRDCFTVSVDKNTLIAACVLRYCIGSDGFKNSNFLKAVNDGKKGEELSKYLTGYRQQLGILNRCYFFAALLANKITFDDLLDLRAEGCYTLTTPEICKCKKNKDGSWKKIKVKRNGKTVTTYDFYTDKDNYCYWIFDDIDEKLKKAKKPRHTDLNVGNGKYVRVDCQLVKDVVADYVWQDVSGGKSSTYVILPANEDKTVNVDSLNDESLYAYQAENYDKSLQDAALALKFAQTNKQRGAAHFNKGMAYMGMCKYGRAKDCFEKSLAENKTKAAQDQLNIAQEKLSEKRKKAGNVALGLGLGLLGIGAIYGGRKYYLMRQKNFGRGK